MHPAITHKRALWYNKRLTLDIKGISFLVALIVVTNSVTYGIISWQRTLRASAASITAPPSPEKELYLLDQASIFIHDIPSFEKKVHKVSNKLSIPPEWLMAVMYSESKFDASVSNSKGSGATGLIQWMPATAGDFGITVEKLRNLNHVEQLDFAYMYLDRVRKKYKDYTSLTELYLAILYPKAIGEDFCYSLYAKPSKAYEMNTILDENKDGRVTVKDIDDRMKRMFPTAYMTQRSKGFLEWMGI